MVYSTSQVRNTPKACSDNDPYAIQKAALMLATWDANKLYLGFTGSDWNLAKRFAIYLDTKAVARRVHWPTMPGGEASHVLPFAADYALMISGVPTSNLSNTGAGSVVSRRTQVSPW